MGEQDIANLSWRQIWEGTPILQQYLVYLHDTYCHCGYIKCMLFLPVSGRQNPYLDTKYRLCIERLHLKFYLTYAILYSVCVLPQTCGYINCMIFLPVSGRQNRYSNIKYCLWYQKLPFEAVSDVCHFIQLISSGSKRLLSKRYCNSSRNDITSVLLANTVPRINEDITQYRDGASI